jgi:hypothetical protein
MVAGTTTAVMENTEGIAATVAIADITAVDGIEAGVVVAGNIVTGMAGTGTAGAGAMTTEANSYSNHIAIFSAPVF